MVLSARVSACMYFLVYNKNNSGPRTDFAFCFVMFVQLIPEPTARSAVPGVSPGRGY